MNWTDGAERQGDSILDAIEANRNRLRDAARVIRHCECDQGYVHGVKFLGEREYQCVSECHCLKAWKGVHRETAEQIRKWEKHTGNEYRNPLTPEMTYFARPKGDKPSREQVERAREAISRFETGVEASV